MSDVDTSTMPSYKNELLQGSLDLLILRTLAVNDAMHGWAISQRIAQVSGDILIVNQGSLYPALHRLEARGLIASEWGLSANNREAKFYRLTRAGRKQVEEETEFWKRFTGAVQLVLQAKGEA